MRVVLAALAAALASGCMHTGKASGPPADQPTVTRPSGTTDSETAALAAFDKNLKEYVELHETLEKTLPPLPKETNPQVIDKHQRALQPLLAEHRKTAKRGDLFTADGERLIRRRLQQAFSGPKGDVFKSTIMDENPVTVKLSINARYPDEVPLSTIPPQLLAMLPKLPEQLEYRFIGPRLILLDVHAHTVADYIDNVLPK